MKERRNWTPPTNTKKTPSYTKMTGERMFDIHRIGKTNKFTTATYPKNLYHKFNPTYISLKSKPHSVSLVKKSSKNI